MMCMGKKGLHRGDDDDDDDDDGKDDDENSNDKPDYNDKGQCQTAKIF